MQIEIFGIERVYRQQLEEAGIRVDLVYEKLTELRDDLSQEIKSGLDIAHDHIRKVKETVISPLKEIAELKEQITASKLIWKQWLRKMNRWKKNSEELNEKLKKTEIYKSNIKKSILMTQSSIQDGIV